MELLLVPGLAEKEKTRKEKKQKRSLSEGELVKKKKVVVPLLQVLLAVAVISVLYWPGLAEHLLCYC